MYIFVLCVCIFVLCILSILKNKSSFRVNNAPSCLPFSLWARCGEVEWTELVPPPPDSVWNSLSEIGTVRKMRKAPDYNSRCQTKPLMRKTKAFGENTAAGSALWLCAQWCVQWSDKSHTRTAHLMLIIRGDNSCLSGRQIDPWSFSLSALSVCLCLINHLSH